MKIVNLLVTFCIFLVTITILSPIKTEAATFTDVPKDHPSASAIEWAKEYQLIVGYETGKFGPNDLVSGQEFAKMLVHFFYLQDGKGQLFHYAAQNVEQEVFDNWSAPYYNALASYSVPYVGYTSEDIRIKPLPRGIVAQAIGYLLTGEYDLETNLSFLYDNGITSWQNPKESSLPAKFGYLNRLTRAQAVTFFYRLYYYGLMEIHESVAAAYQQSTTEKEAFKAQAMTAMNTLNALLIEESKRNPISNERKKLEEIFIPVKKLLQTPELPNGCEITALTALLNFYGYSVSKTTMADQFLPKQPFTWKNGVRYGPDPYKAYAGDPRSKTGGWYSFAPPIIRAAEAYFNTQNTKKIAKNLHGSDKNTLLSYLEQNIPVVVWTTLDLSKPRLNFHWYISDSGNYYKAYTNLHAVVLNGYKKGKVHVMNPLIGQVEYNMDAFFKSYEEMGKHALVLLDDESN